MPAFIGLPGQTEWIIILIIALLIFGKRLPSVMRSMGQSLRQFKKGMEDLDADDDADTEGDEQKETPGSDSGNDDKEAQ